MPNREDPRFSGAKGLPRVLVTCIGYSIIELGGQVVADLCKFYKKPVHQSLYRQM